MAVDTRDKRFSMMGLLQPVPSILPNPDGTIDSNDMYQYIFLYHGITIDPLAPVLVSRWFERSKNKRIGLNSLVRGPYHARNF